VDRLKEIKSVTFDQPSIHGACLQRIILSQSIVLPDAPLELERTLKDKLTLMNPVWVDNEKQGRWNKGIPKHLEFFRETETGLEIPRGYMRHLITELQHLNRAFEIDDRRRKLPEVDFHFSGELKPFQQNAVTALMKKHFAVLTAPTGSGKTVMILAVIALRKQPTLIVVHTKELAAQWLERIEKFLGIPPKNVGLIGSGKHRIGSEITVAMVQTLYKCTEEIAPLIGNLVVDECHRTPSRTFHQAVSAFDAYYMTGLSATPFRRDRLSRLIFWYLGDEAYQVDKKDLVHRGDILQAEVIFRVTGFSSATDPTHQYTRLMEELVADMERNRLIADDIATEVRTGKGVCLVLSDRKSHCRIIRDLLRTDHGIDADLLTGDLRESERKDLIERLEQGRISILIATSQLLGEGFDSDKLTRLFLIYPIRFKGRLLQYLGRILRPGKEKKARVFDYVDANIPVLEAAAKARRNAYMSD
jgi:superfamily II DNA or RNA helicase